MNRADISHIVQSVLVEHFNVATTPAIWNNALENLNENFRYLGFLVELEEILQSRFNTKILLVEYISATIHTPEDIVVLIFETLNSD